jgi:hypothetical protein
MHQRFHVEDDVKLDLVVLGSEPGEAGPVVVDIDTPLLEPLLQQLSLLRLESLHLVGDYSGEVCVARPRFPARLNVWVAHGEAADE